MVEYFSNVGPTLIVHWYVVTIPGEFFTSDYSDLADEALAELGPYLGPKVAGPIIDFKNFVSGAFAGGSVGAILTDLTLGFPLSTGGAKIFSEDIGKLTELGDALRNGEAPSPEQLLLITGNLLFSATFGSLFTFLGDLVSVIVGSTWDVVEDNPDNLEYLNQDVYDSCANDESTSIDYVSRNCWCKFILWHCIFTVNTQ
jgi:hypothetical protein